MRRRSPLPLFACAFLLASACGSPPTVDVENVDGPDVLVTPWAGAPATPVDCGHGVFLNTDGAPGQPWLVTVRSATDHRVLGQQTWSGDIEVIVRSGGAVLMGHPAPSVGPPGVGCPAGP